MIKASANSNSLGEFDTEHGETLMEPVSPTT